nr:hypothetical protein [Streptomyces sp. AP-93]
MARQYSVRGVSFAEAMDLSVIAWTWSRVRGSKLRCRVASGSP